ncbi:MAG TPA: ribose-phosphate diphosphokinase [Candidatus Saccharimonadales bacterium]|nr:ribose-phosphate diphosphokinase [Candidatus Saccharimonadales bacterium]
MIEVEQRRLLLLSGRAHPSLAREIAGCLDVKLGKIELGNFANREISCRLNESVRGCDVFIIQSHSGKVNDAIIEQALVIDAAKRASATSVTAVCPFLGYARQDRKSDGREPIAAKLIVDILAKAGADRIITVDLHSGQTQGFFDGPFDHLIARPTLLDYVQKNFKDNLVVVSPDAGRVKMAERYSTILNCGMAIIHKHRSTKKHNAVEAKYLIGNVKGKNCVIIDDMIDTAGTICAAADLLREKGAKKIYGLATHGLFSGNAIKSIEKSSFNKVVVTNTLPQRPSYKNTKIEVVSIAKLIADAIAAVFAGSSVSAIFDGQNQI